MFFFGGGDSNLIIRILIYENFVDLLKLKEWLLSIGIDLFITC